MPLYDYRCTGCGKTFEVRVTFSRSDEPVQCPDCQNPAQRLMPESFTLFSKSWSGWVRRVEGSDHPWRDVKVQQAEPSGNAESQGNGVESTTKAQSHKDP